VSGWRSYSTHPELADLCSEPAQRLWQEPQAESAIWRIARSTERRGRTTTVALQTSAQNGTYVCAREGISLATSNPRFWQLA
jgi:hypothetical protein